MKIDVKLNLQKLSVNSERYIDKVDTYESIYISGSVLRNLHYIYGAETDDFKTLAKLFFLMSNQYEEMEDDDITKELQILEKSFLHFAVKQQFDL